MISSEDFNLWNLLCLVQRMYVLMSIASCSSSIKILREMGCYRATNLMLACVQQWIVSIPTFGCPLHSIAHSYSNSVPCNFDHELGAFNLFSYRNGYSSLPYIHYPFLYHLYLHHFSFGQTFLS